MFDYVCPKINFGFDLIADLGTSFAAGLLTRWAEPPSEYNQHQKSSCHLHEPFGFADIILYRHFTKSFFN